MIDFSLISVKSVLHAITSALLIPTIAILFLFMALTIVELGSLIVEIIVERRKVKINIPELVADFQGKDSEYIMDKIEHSSLFKRQKAVFSEWVKYSYLPIGSLQALASKLLIREELHYDKITSKTDIVVRLGPMFGLMATLIPLGPGLIALGQGDTKTLADSLLTAFDATVSGLASAGVAFFISKLRKGWYEDYVSSVESLMECLLEVFEHEREIKK
ncbi:hypothetical protein CLRAG_34040 [Clostridium ragsdalei P11]|uniref:MotA/TolQ/ExbB proton channel domain-containing protein n=1 Tax=Clostridium ragsdalei P11 TaxID=1353534 RepID=A0A1A6AL29_9CLOT|nr:MotA/TolQ/ExbB proton channel family protein [Clostridium ragsdalei]OBR90756.1 hypothetical protein CLRAG_34040 [Clostridium ragsdalei P11]